MHKIYIIDKIMCELEGCIYTGYSDHKRSEIETSLKCAVENKQKNRKNLNHKLL